MPTQTAPSPQADARERLLAAALEQFGQRGYAATSTRELCAAAEVTKPVLYYYFKSKEGLYLQLMEDSYRLFETTLAELSGFSGTTRQRVNHFCQGILATCLEQLPRVRLLYSVYYGTPQGAPPFDLDRYYDRLLEVLADLVEEGIARSEIRPGRVSDRVWTVLACLSIAIEEQLCHASPRLAGGDLARMLDLIFEGLAVPQAAQPDNTRSTRR